MGSGTARALAIALAGLAGFVDALGFLSLGGFYVAFMSGNSTLLSIGLATGAEARVALAGGLVASFVGGVVFGTLVGPLMARQRAAGVLVLVAVLLTAAWALHAAGAGTAAGLVLAMGMGTENTVFQTQRQAGVGLTYMTGTLVRLGHRLAEALGGGPWWAVVPDALLWGMLVGASLGALMFRAVGLDALWCAVGAALAMAVTAWFDARRVRVA